MMMKHTILSILFAVALPVTASAQLFRPLGLDTDRCKRVGPYSQPRMHIEGDKLYVCTSQGLYAKDLNDKESAWQLAGFEGIPLQDYARRGSDILALRFNKGGGYLLLSHDGGQTYEDVTPDIFCQEEFEALPCLVQHPTDPNTLLVASVYKGILRSKDFGQTWEQIADFFVGNSESSIVGFHPARPDIIYNSGETWIMSGHIAISYDGGKIWNHYDTSRQKDKDKWLGFSGDNCVHRPAFHPTNPDRWIAGGEGCVFLSDNNGQTWSCLNYWSDEPHSAYWYFTAFDDEHPDTVYMAGCLGPNKGMGLNARVKIMCSTNGGRSWYESQVMESKMEVELVNDLQQYRDRLMIYTESGVYEVSKAELIARSTNAIRSVTKDDPNAPIYDLQGRRRTTEPRHGLFIKNGQKKVQ